MQKQIFSFAILLLFFLDCKKGSAPNESFMMLSKPRTCEKIMILPAKFLTIDLNGKKYKSYKTLGNTPVRPLDYVLTVFTGDFLIDTLKR